MHAPATPAQPTTIPVQGFTEMVLKHLPEVNGVKKSDLEFAARGFFNPVRGRERISVRELSAIISSVQTEMDRRMTKALGFPQGSQDTIRAIALGFSCAVAELKANPQAAEPIVVNRKPESARPSVPREYMRPPQAAPAAAPKLPADLQATDPIAVTRHAAPERERRVESMRPVTSSRKIMPPLGWLGMVKSAEKIGVAPIKLQPTWKQLIAAAEKCTPDARGVRNVPLGEGHVRMLFGGARKPTWYMHPEDLRGPLKDAVDATRRVREPRIGKPANPLAPEGWCGILKIVPQMHSSPKIVRAVFDPLTERATACEPDAQGIRNVPLGDGHVRMLFGGPRKPTWYIHPDDIKGPFKAAVDAHKAELKALRPQKEKPEKNNYPLPPEGWLGMIAAVKTARTSPDKIRKQWMPLCKAAEQCEPDEQGIRTVPFGETTVRMLLGGTRKPSWYMHPDDVAGALRAAIEQEKTAARAERFPPKQAKLPREKTVKPPKEPRPEKPEGYMTYSAILQRIGGTPDDLKIVWNGLVYEAERHTPNEQGIVAFTQKEGPVQMWRGGRMNSWHISEESYENVVLARYRNMKLGLHTDRVAPALIARDLPKAQRGANGKENGETSLSHVGRVRARAQKPERVYAINEQSQFEISAVVGLTLDGVSGRIPRDVEERLRRETDRAFAPYKERSVVTKGDIQSVIDRSKAEATNPALPRETQEVHRAVSTTLENALARLNTIAPVPQTGAGWRQRAQQNGGASREAS